MYWLRKRKIIKWLHSACSYLHIQTISNVFKPLWTKKYKKTFWTLCTLENMIKSFLLIELNIKELIGYAFNFFFLVLLSIFYYRSSVWRDTNWECVFKNRNQKLCKFWTKPEKFLKINVKHLFRQSVLKAGVVIILWNR